MLVRQRTSAGASAASPAELGELRIQERAAEDEVFDLELAVKLLRGPADLARTADGQEQGVLTHRDDLMEVLLANEENYLLRVATTLVPAGT
ncbi:hypothetical protein [Streptomyces geranii]|uniref:hypothetical protein n=1 Tax=Streptomyces geranii TaxID=2058923 RepID=UPI001300997C|nr:hypothetical protein [Streptomyces geranii]